MSNVVNLPKLFTEGEAMTYLGKSQNTMYRLRKSNNIGFIQVGNSIKYTEKHLLDYLESQACPAKKSPSQMNTSLSNERDQTTGTLNGGKTARRSDALRALQMLPRPE